MDIPKIFNIFQDDFYIDKGAIEEAIQYQSMFNIIHNDTVFKIDFVIRKRRFIVKPNFIENVAFSSMKQRFGL